MIFFDNRYTSECECVLFKGTLEDKKNRYAGVISSSCFFPQRLRRTYRGVASVPTVATPLTKLILESDGCTLGRCKGGLGACSFAWHGRRMYDRRTRRSLRKMRSVQKRRRRFRQMEMRLQNRQRKTLATGPETKCRSPRQLSREALWAGLVLILMVRQGYAGGMKGSDNSSWNFPC